MCEPQSAMCKPIAWQGCNAGPAMMKACERPLQLAFGLDGDHDRSWQKLGKAAWAMWEFQEWSRKKRLNYLWHGCQKQLHCHNAQQHGPEAWSLHAHSWKLKGMTIHVLAVVPCCHAWLMQEEQGWGWEAEVPVAWLPKAVAMPRCSAASPRGVEVAWALT